jgi:hypothetical protein
LIRDGKNLKLTAKLHKGELMRPKLWIFVLMLILLGVSLLVSACTLPTDEEDEAAKQTAIAQTVEAALPDETTEDPTATPTVEEEPDDETADEDGGDDTGEDNTTVLATNTPTATPDGDEDEDDSTNKAKFVTDVTIPDGSEFEPGEKITKTWRVQNVGDTTWTTEYTIVFKEGERLGAPVSIPMPKEVKPDEMIDLSIEFTVPSVEGEYRSDWMFKNADGEEFGTGEGYKFPIYLVIVSSEDGGGSSSDSGGIAGGAKVTGATVSVDKPNFSGKCPPTITFTYTVTTSNAGKVNFNLVFNALSPSGFKFDPPPEYSVNFTGGYTVTYTYTFLPSNSVTATARVKAVGSNTFTSDPINFSISCN